MSVLPHLLVLFFAQYLKCETLQLLRYLFDIWSGSNWGEVRSVGVCIQGLDVLKINIMKAISNAVSKFSLL